MRISRWVVVVLLAILGMGLAGCDQPQTARRCDSYPGDCDGDEWAARETEEAIAADRSRDDYYASLAEEANRKQMDDYNYREGYREHLSDLYAQGQADAADPDLDYDAGAVDCDDFDYQDEAQAYYEGTGGLGSDPFWLDDDQDGLACEMLPAWRPPANWCVESPGLDLTCAVRPEERE